MTRWYTHGPTLVREKIGGKEEMDKLAAGAELGHEIRRVIHYFHPIMPLTESEALKRSSVNPVVADKLTSLRGQPSPS